MLDVFLLVFGVLGIFCWVLSWNTPRRSKEGYSNRAGGLRAVRSLKKIRRMKF